MEISTLILQGLRIEQWVEYMMLADCRRQSTLAEGGGREPKIIESMKDLKLINRPHGFNRGGEKDIAPTCTSSKWQDNNFVLEPMCSVHPNSHKFEFNPETSVKSIAPALRATDYKAPHCVYELPKQDNEILAYIEKYAKDNGIEKLDFEDIQQLKAKYHLEHAYPNQQLKYRIRKLTPRECFRLMGVDDADIDKIQTSGISNSQQYKLAGNSIVVDTLYHIFRKMFCEKKNENLQQTLF